MFKATFSGNDTEFQARFDNDESLRAVFDDFILATPNLVHIDTTANWNAQRDLVGLKTHLYVYIDYIVEDGIAYPGFKFGDGQAYLIDLPFVSGNEATSGAVYVDTTANWNAKPQLIGKTNHVYVYSDYFMIDGMGVPGMKIGDGMAYLIDLPFVSGNDTRLNEHIADTEVHITNAERLFWNNKVTCFMSNGDEENIVFTKDNV